MLRPAKGEPGMTCASRKYGAPACRFWASFTGNQCAVSISTTMHTSATGNPTGVNWNMPSAGKPARTASELTTRLVLVPTSVTTPPRMEA